MPKGQSAWNEFVKPYLKKDRRGGLKAASAAWHGRRRESNPGIPKIVKWGVLGVGAYWLYGKLKGQPAPTTPTTPARP